MTGEAGPAAPGGTLARAAAALLAVLALLKAGVSGVPFPHWDGDPFTTAGPLVAWGPTALLGLDIACCIAAAVALLVPVPRADPRAALVGTALLALGAVGVLVHGLRSLEHLAVGSAWVGGMALGIGAWRLAADPRARAILIAAALGFTAMLAAKGAQQVWIEHPITIEHFEQHREAFYEARGWTPDSRSALVYERRLAQPAPTGWFGLSNVVATFAAAGLVGLAGLAAGAWPRSRAATAALGLGALACAGTLALTGSKGGWGAAVIGLGLLTFARLAHTRAPLHRIVPWCLVLVPFAVLALILARGALGERLGDLSLLFRSFYLEGAARIIADHPIWGVGPDGFKDAYVLARPPLSPEEVSSPHALLADWPAMLGLFGVAWCGLLLWWAHRAGHPGPIGQPDAATPRALLQDTKLVALIAVGVTIASAYVERPTATIDTSLLRLAGLGGWIAVSWGVLAAMQRGACAWTAAACAGGAAALLAHSQLDLAGTHLGSAGLLFLLIGALAGAAPGDPPGQPRHHRLARGVGLVPLILGGAIAVIGLGPTRAWERHLDEAADRAMRLSEVTADLEGAGFQPQALVVAQRFAAEAGLPPPGSVGGIGLMLDTARGVALAEAAEGLTRAHAARPDHQGTMVALCRIELARIGRDPEAADRALAIAEDAARRRAGSGSAWMWLGSVRAGVAELPGFEGRAEGLRRGAMEAWERAAALDPRGPDAPIRLMEMAQRLGDPVAAGAWARRALEADEGMRLDPLKRLSEGERARALGLAGGAAQP